MNKRVNLDELVGSRRIDYSKIDRQPVSNEDFLRILALLKEKVYINRDKFFLSLGSRNYEQSLQSLIQTASQYREHAYKTLGDQVEFDLRLAEAEETLYRMKHPFQALFRRTPFDRARKRENKRQ